MYEKFIKRLIDIFLSIILLPLLVVLLLVFSPWIYLEDHGCVLYFDKRLGKDYKPFTMFKFRTMKVDSPDIRNSDGSTFNSQNDNRLTKIGKFLRKYSIDEMPQILNILLGQMSFVGPRPSTLKALNYTSANLKNKMSVKPGVTGYSQAYYRNSIHGEERYKNDIYYINNMSLALDIRIILKTVINVIKKDNIYTNDK